LAPNLPEKTLSGINNKLNLPKNWIGGDEGIGKLPSARLSARISARK